MEEAEFRTQLIKRLDIVIRLLLDEAKPSSDKTIASMAHSLKAMGLSSTQIGSILSKPTKDIAAVFSKRAKTKGKA